METLQSIFQTTPVKPKVDALLRWSYQLPDLQELRRKLSEDMRAHWVGLPSPQDFMSYFMDRAPEPVPLNVSFPSVAGKAENDMYMPLVRTSPVSIPFFILFQRFCCKFKTVLKYRLCPNLPFYITAHARKTRDQLRPDGGAEEHPSLWKSGSAPSTSAVVIDAGNRRQTRSMTRTTAKPAPPPAPKHVPFDWHTHGLIAEFKDTAKQDPFYDLEQAREFGTIERSDDTSYLVRGQLAQYASQLFNHQHRTHAFQLFVVGNYARFIYWDRAGAVVSSRFNYVENPEILAEFFWMYNHMPPVRRGWDASVSEPSKKEVLTFRTAVKKLLADMEDPISPQRRINRAENTLDKDYPAYKMTVGAVKTGETQDIIIQKPFDICQSPTGRATRAYVAYSLTKNRLVFLKDSWRVHVKDLSDEDSIYFRLTSAKVPFTPRVLCAGDVQVDGVPQVTRTQELARKQDAKWRMKCSASRTHMHHRIIQEFAYSLSTSANSKEYTQAFRDAIAGMWQTIIMMSNRSYTCLALDGAKEAGILHRDISFNNIMLDDEGRAIVNDWDHAGNVKSDPGRPHKTFRTVRYVSLRRCCCILIASRVLGRSCRSLCSRTPSRFTTSLTTWSRSSGLCCTERSSTSPVLSRSIQKHSFSNPRSRSTASSVSWEVTRKAGCSKALR